MTEPWTEFNLFYLFTFFRHVWATDVYHYQHVWRKWKSERFISVIFMAMFTLPGWSITNPIFKNQTWATFVCGLTVDQIWYTVVTSHMWTWMRMDRSFPKAHIVVVVIIVIIQCLHQGLEISYFLFCFFFLNRDGICTSHGPLFFSCKPVRMK